MWLKQVLAIAFIMALPAAKARRKPKCDTTGVDLYSAVDGFLTRLPMQYALPGQSYRPVVTGIAGIRIGKAKVTGLNWLRRYGALKPYCLDGKLLVQADVVNKGDVVISVPWKTCSGSRGTIKLRTQFSRFTIVLRVEDYEFGQPFLFPEEGMLTSQPVIATEPSLTVEGAGESVEAGSSALSRFFPVLSGEMWNSHFFSLFNEAAGYVGNNVIPM